MKKIKKILLVVLVIFLIWIVFYYLIKLVFVVPYEQEQYIEKNCPNFVSHSSFIDPTRFIDCKGVVSIEQYVKDNFLTVFVVAPDYNFPLSIQTLKYKFVGNYMYYIEDLNLQLLYYSHYGDDSYETTLPLETGQKDSFFSINDIPLYRKVDINTGKFTLYKRVNNAPMEEREIFQKLIDSK